MAKYPSLYTPLHPPFYAGVPWVVIISRWGSQAERLHAHSYLYKSNTYPIPAFTTKQLLLDFDAALQTFAPETLTEDFWYGPHQAYAWNGVSQQIHGPIGGFQGAAAGETFPHVECVLCKKQARRGSVNVTARWHSPPVPSFWLNADGSLNTLGAAAYAFWEIFLGDTFTSQGVSWTPCIYNHRGFTDTISPVELVSMFPRTHIFRKRLRDSNHIRSYSDLITSPLPDG